MKREYVYVIGGVFIIFATLILYNYWKFGRSILFGGELVYFWGDWTFTCPSQHDSKTVEKCIVNTVLRSCWTSEPRFAVFCSGDICTYKIDGTEYQQRCTLKESSYQRPCWEGSPDGYYATEFGTLHDLIVGQTASWSSVKVPLVGSCISANFEDVPWNWGWEAEFIYKGEARNIINVIIESFMGIFG